MKTISIEHDEDAQAVLQGAAHDLDAVAARTATAADRLARAGYDRMAAVTRQAAVDAARAAHVLRRDGVFGVAAAGT